MTDSHRLAQGRARVRSVAVSATAASILAAAGIAFALPGVTASKASTCNRQHRPEVDDAQADREP